MRGRNWLTLEMLEFGSVNVFWDLWSDSLEAIYLVFQFFLIAKGCMK